MFSFFLRTWYGMFAGFFLILFIVFFVLVIVMFLLAITGGPGPCTPGGGPISVSAANSQSFKTKWDALDAALDGGSAASTDFNESEVTSRAQEFDEAEDTPFDDIRVCIHDGFGEGTAKFGFLGLSTKVKVKGTMELAGPHPVAQIDDIKVGNVPGFLTSVVEGLVEDAIDEALDKVDLKHPYVPTLSEGQARIDGQP